MSKPNPNSTKPQQPKMSDIEYFARLKSKNPLNQIKLLTHNIREQRSKPASTYNRVDRFKLKTLIFGVAVIMWVSYTRTNVMRLKNQDDATFLADQEIRRILQKES